MLRLDCDRCSRDIIDDEIDADGIRVQIAKATKTDDAEFLYVMSGDEDGEPTGKHYCSSCIVALLKGAGIVVQSVPDEEPEVEPEVEPEAGADEASSDKE